MATVAAVIALCAVGIATVVIVILHFVERDYDPSWRMLSEYSLGRYGWLMRIAFVAMALSAAAACVALWPAGGGWTIGLAIVALGPLGAAFVDTDPITTPRAETTAAGRIHSALGALYILGFPLAASLAGTGSAADLGWTLAIASVVPWAGLVWFLGVTARSSTADAGSPEVRVGWPNRVGIAGYFAWIALAGAVVLWWS